MPPVDICATCFVVRDGATLLRLHPTLGTWLPPGGHVEPGEHPQDAALRETAEEVGIDAEALRFLHTTPGHLADDRAVPMALPQQILLERIAEEHVHYDIVFVAELATGTEARVIDDAEIRWFGRVDLDDPATPIWENVRRGAHLALDALDET